MNTRLFTFAGGETVTARCSDGCRGGSLSPGIPRLDVAAGSVSPQPLAPNGFSRDNE
jgi:hypothetical protein